MQGYIYLIENKINGKKYVGCTVYTIEHRFQEHIKTISRSPNRPLYRAMKKYGIGNFSISALEECDESLLAEREIYWIEKLDTYKNGYNATLGGEGRRSIDHEKAIELYDKYQVMNKVASELGCDRRSVRLILENNGVVLNKDALTLASKKVLIVELNLTFDSILQCGQWLIDNGYSKASTPIYAQKSISRVLNGDRATYCKLHFGYS